MIEFHDEQNCMALKYFGLTETIQFHILHIQPENILNEIISII